ncbi:hypothetical protein TraAM80_05900 [Trypanosoma rangeli]|uniref:Uncharacterized protein n=1 Tax=Trypanosoma rangeli TaxID=5698 RepID=A0A3R7KBF0_TRYRA|nr:uncharacterized protein TraAM80_05900 [Trypanosoma rangeli]RNF03168.1 hypothetical protein TraAM80_05900 [Trypanosoma rangeli]|eukprot:RNF03168.1 hypothetical protein TraAM80_05900 [Trypanosoma rangeli]
MEDKLRGATREELMSHVLTQRRLIRHLHRRVVELEREVSLVSRSSPPRRSGATALSVGLRKIGRVLQAHASGALHLPQEFVAEFLYIQKELAAAASGEAPTPSSGRPAASPPEEGSSVPRRFSPPGSLIQRTQQRLSVIQRDETP